MRKVLYILGKLADSDIDWLVDVGSRRALNPGEVLVEEGGTLECLFLVLDGTMTVTSRRAPGVTLATLAMGEIIGEVSFLDLRPSSAQVAARGDAAVLCIARSALAARMERDQGFAARLYRAFGVVLADRLRSTLTRLGKGEPQELDDELGDDMLDDVTLAGTRFEWMLERLRSGR